MRSVAIALTLLLVAVPARGQVEVRHTLPQPAIEMAAEGVRVPMSFRVGRPTVEARLNGQGPYRFYFDTGASGPVISQKLATELKFDVVGEVQMKSGGDAPDKKPIPGQLVRIERLELGIAKITGAIVAAMDRARLGGADAPVGVLSPATFSGYLVTLDYPKKELRIRSGRLGAPDNKSIFGYLPNRPIPSVMAKIDDQMIEMHVDSGSAGGFSLSTKVASRLKLDGAPVDTGKKARSVSGVFPILEGKLRGALSFGEFSFTDPKIEFSDVVRFGNIGAQILDHFSITLDIKNRRFQLTKEG
jgi:hypothetical protein